DLPAAPARSGIAKSPRRYCLPHRLCQTRKLAGTRPALFGNVLDRIWHRWRWARKRGRRMNADVNLDRYSRQMRFFGIGEEGQKRLLQSHVTLCGCGALGTVLANALGRAGVGHLRLIDRDFIETNNLQRQVLFDEHDVAENLPKAEAAARKLGAINSSVFVEPVVTDIDRTNIIELV